MALPLGALRRGEAYFRSPSACDQHIQGVVLNNMLPGRRPSHAMLLEGETGEPRTAEGRPYQNT